MPVATITARTRMPRNQNGCTCEAPGAGALGSLPVPGIPGTPLTLVDINCSFGVPLVSPIAKTLVTVFWSRLVENGMGVLFCAVLMLKVYDPDSSAR